MFAEVGAGYETTYQAGTCADPTTSANKIAVKFTQLGILLAIA